MQIDREKLKEIVGYSLLVVGIAAIVYFTVKYFVTKHQHLIPEIEKAMIRRTLYTAS